MKSAVHLDTHTVTDIEFQAASVDIWDAKYRLVEKDGAKIDISIDDTYKRVAKALADVETESKDKAYVLVQEPGAAENNRRSSIRKEAQLP